MPKGRIKKLSKYLYILLMTLRKLPRNYPDDKTKYLTRYISVKVNIVIDLIDKNSAIFEK